MDEENEHRGSLASRRHEEQIDQDARDLAALGHEQELTRKFNMWSMLALAFTVLGTYSTLAQNLGSGISAGGPVDILYGLILVALCNVCVAVSLGELASSMPTALAQAYWISALWTTPTGRFLSYMCAWINTFGWWTLTASQVAFMTEFLLYMKNIFDIDWPGSGYGWLNLVVYIGLTAVLTLINVVACRKDRVLPWINNVVGIQFAALFVVFILAWVISAGTKDGLSYQPARFVFGTFSNDTGWPNGVIWFTSLVQSSYGLTAFDACLHLIEEMPNPSRTGPRIVWLSVVFGALSGFVFMMTALFCIQDLDAIEGADFPFIELTTQTVGTVGGAILIAFFIFNGIGQNISIMTTASRLTWSFARDGGLPFHRYLAGVNRYWKVPVRALWAQGAVIAVISVLYLFAQTVLQAILSVSTIALTISYAMPITALLVVGRDKLVPGPFHLGRWGMPANIVSLCYCAVTTVFFFFPSSPNPGVADMNYAIAVFGVMLVIALGFWVVQGRRSYLRTENSAIRIVAGANAQHLEGGWEDDHHLQGRTTPVKGALYEHDDVSDEHAKKM